jgi:hypothetical protein
MSAFQAINQTCQARDMSGLPQQDERIRMWTAGVEFAVTFGVFTVVGFWLDSKLDMLPLWTLIGLAVGFAAALYRLIRLVRPRKPSGKRADQDNS